MFGNMVVLLVHKIDTNYILQSIVLKLYSIDSDDMGWYLKYYVQFSKTV